MKLRMTALLMAGVMMLNVMPVAAEETETIVCVGDSLTFGVISGTPGERDVTYPDTLQSLLGDGYEVMNLGKPGHTLTEAGACYLKRPEYELSIEEAADMYIIMLGTNDSNLGDKWDATAFEEDLNKVVDDYREANPDTIIVLVAPPIVVQDKMAGRRM